MNFLIVLLVIILKPLVANSRLRTEPSERNDDTFEVLDFGNPTYHGSGCPNGSVMAVRSPGNEALSVLFSQFRSSTKKSKRNVKKSCNLVIPVSVKKGYSVTIYKTEYRGYTFVPRGYKKTYTKFAAEYTFAGTKGPKIKNKFKKTGNFYFAPEIEVTVTSEEATNVNLRINTSLTARKKKKKYPDPYINVDSIDLTSEERDATTEFRYYLKTEKIS